MERPKLSVIILTKNEERNISRALESLKLLEVPYEAIVVDARSDDRTVEIAKELGARVFLREWKGYKEQREYSLTVARGEWILFLDADEWLSEGIAKEISNICRNSKYDGYKVIRMNYYLGRFMKNTYDKILRLARKDKVRIAGKYVHERIEVDGKYGITKHRILHIPYRNLMHHWEKNTKYAYLSALEKFEAGRRPNILDFTLRLILTFLKHFLIRRAFMEGLPGLIYSISQTWYVFQKYALLYEMYLESNDKRKVG